MGKYNGRIKIDDKLKVGTIYKFVNDGSEIDMQYLGKDPFGMHSFLSMSELEIIKGINPALMQEDEDPYVMVEDVGTYIDYEVNVRNTCLNIKVDVPYSYEGMNEQTFHFDQLARQVLANTKPYRPKS
jgi:hypothetical protein